MFGHHREDTVYQKLVSLPYDYLMPVFSDFTSLNVKFSKHVKWVERKS